MTSSIYFLVIWSMTVRHSRATSQPSFLPPLDTQGESTTSTFEPWTTTITHTTPINTPFPNTRSPLSPNPTSSAVEQYQQFLEVCPFFRPKMHEKCRQVAFSCRGMCGKNRDLFSCQCDPTCLVYRDCCWDFQAQCPSEVKLIHAAYGSRLTDTRVTCVGNSPIIDSCGANTDTHENKTYTQRDFRVPVVSVGGDLAFRNMTVYKQCLGDMNVSRSVHSWNIFVGLRKGASTRSLQNFLHYGIVDHNVYTNPSYSNFSRICLDVFTIQCSKLPENHQCGSIPDMSLYGSDLLCRYTSESEVQSDRVTLSPLKMDAKISSQHTSDKSTCRLWRRVAISHTPKDSEFPLIFRMNFSQGVNIPHIRSVAQNEHLKGHSCKDNNNSTPCDIVASCHPGYLTVDLICRKPTVFLAQVVGISSDQDSSKLENFILDLFESVERSLQLFRGINYEEFKNTMDISSNETYDYITVLNFLPVRKESNLVYDGKQLPVTDTIIQLDEGGHSSVQKLTLCFVLGEDLYHGRSLLCDRVLQSGKKGSWVLDSHYTIAGARLPEPSVDMLVMTAGTSRLWSLRMCQLLYVPMVLVSTFILSQTLLNLS